MKRRAVFVLRHGEPADTSIFYGQLDVPLSPRGERQVAGQVALLREAGIERIISSDLVRARIGAAAIGAAVGLEVELFAGLREMHLGMLEGVPMRDAIARHPEVAGRSYEDMLDYRMPQGGESVRDVDRRATPIVEEAIAAQGSGALLVYAHNTVVRLLLARASGLGAEGYVRFKQGYGALSRIDASAAKGAEVWQRSCVVWSNRAAEPDGG